MVKQQIIVESSHLCISMALLF